MSVDNNTTNSVPKSPASRARWFGLAAVALGVSVIIMDATVVNVALPVIIRDLHLSSTQAEWMNAVYALMFAALLLIVGRLGDLKGRRKLFFIGIVIFTIASVAAGLSTSGGMLIAARLVQGIGAEVGRAASYDDRWSDHAPLTVRFTDG